MANRRYAYRIDELDCADEVRQLRRGLESRPGVVQLEFDILNQRMDVELEDVASELEFVDWVAETGMHARPWKSNGGTNEDTWWQQHGRTTLTVASGCLLSVAFLTDVVAGGGHVAAFGEGGVTLAAQCLYGLSILVGMRHVAPRAWASIRQRRADMHLLMTVAVAGAVFLGQWLEAAMVTFLFCLALLLEHWSVGRARRAIASLLDLSPATARCVDVKDGVVTERPVDAVGLCETVQVRPGEKIPLDGVLTRGTSSVNQAPITGESRPVAKDLGDALYAGTINGEGAIEFSVTRLAGDTTLARIIHLAQQANAQRAPTEQWVEVFARYYTPAMFAMALLMAVVPPVVLQVAWRDSIYNALVLLVIACPCALVISTPVSIVSALTTAARHGVLIKGGRFLEAAAHLRAVAVDKTGTLTHGKPVVQDVFPLNGHSPEELLQRAAAMEAPSTHPIAQAILQSAQARDIALVPVEDYRALDGRGAEARFQGQPFWIGNRRLMLERMPQARDVHERLVHLEDAGHSIVAIGNDDHVCGLISIADAVRPEAATAVQQLRRLGVRRVSMLTGDSRETARGVAQWVGVDDCFAEFLPEDKVRQVEALRREHGSVAMVGDGVNDAPAMAAATLSIAMGAIGTDTAIETADVALMSDDLSKVPWLIALARRTLAIIQQNVAVALGLKLLFVGLALAGAATLWAAIAADTGASLLVIFNGMRLLQTPPAE